MISISRHHESGFTLQEVLVAVNVGFLMVSFCLLLFLSVTKLVGTWQNRALVRNTVNTAINRISIDTEISEVIMVYPDTLIELYNRNGGVISYRFQEGKVIRNDILINVDNEIQIAGALIQYQTNKGNSVLAVELTGWSGRYKYKEALTTRTNPDSESVFIKAGV